MTPCGRVATSSAKPRDVTSEVLLAGELSLRRAAKSECQCVPIPAVDNQLSVLYNEASLIFFYVFCYSVGKYKTFLTGRFSLKLLDEIGTVPASSKSFKESWPTENSSLCSKEDTTNIVRSFLEIEANYT